MKNLVLVIKLSTLALKYIELMLNMPRVIAIVDEIVISSTLQEVRRAKERLQSSKLTITFSQRMVETLLSCMQQMRSEETFLELQRCIEKSF